jgi:hypothetical protein
MIKVFNKNHDTGLTLYANDSALSGQIDAKTVSVYDGRCLLPDA